VESPKSLPLDTLSATFVSVVSDSCSLHPEYQTHITEDCNHSFGFVCKACTIVSIILSTFSVVFVLPVVQYAGFLTLKKLCLLLPLIL
jgi:hypothetical protein